MARQPRIRYAGAFYHVFNRGVNKKAIYFTRGDRVFFLKVLGEAKVKFNVRIFAYCLMENHYHLFVQTDHGNLDKFMQSLQGRFAQCTNLRRGRVGTLFQGRYQSRLVDVDSYALALTRYIHRNPLEVDGVERCEDYAWSSYATYLNLGPKLPWLDTDLVLRLLDNDTQTANRLFRDFHEQVPLGSDPSFT